MPFTLWGGRVRSRALSGMSKSWYRWGWLEHCCLNSPKHPTVLCTLMASSLALEVHWPAVQPLSHSFPQVQIPLEKCPGEDTNSDFKGFNISLYGLVTYICLYGHHTYITWSHSDCNIVPTSSLHCCCCKEWSAGGTNRESSEENRSPSCSSPEPDPDSRCSVALLHAFCDTSASIKESRRRTWPQHTVFPSALQLTHFVHLKSNSQHTHKQLSAYGSLTAAAPPAATPTASSWWILRSGRTGPPAERTFSSAWPREEGSWWHTHTSTPRKTLSTEPVCACSTASLCLRLQPHLGPITPF